MASMDTLAVYGNNVVGWPESIESSYHLFIYRLSSLLQTTTRDAVGRASRAAASRTFPL